MLTVIEAATRLGIGRIAVERLIAQKKLEAQNFGTDLRRVWRIPESSIEALLAGKACQVQDADVLGERRRAAETVNALANGVSAVLSGQEPVKQVSEVDLLADSHEQEQITAPKASSILDLMKKS